MITSISMRATGHVTFANLVLSVVVAFSATGCEAPEPLVPRAVYERVNDDGREWTYDTAWQNIRSLNANLEAVQLDTVVEEALFIASQMERLETGKAGPLTSPEVVGVVEDAARAAENRNRPENLRFVKDFGQRLQERFDAGDFESAKSHALSLYATALSLQ